MSTALTATGVQFPDSSVLGTNPLPAGTRLLFHNSTAPTGWTKDTTINDSALRVVSGTPGSGGSSGFASALGSPTVSGSVSLSGDPGVGNLSTSITGNVNIGSTTLSESQMPSHNHAIPSGSGGAYQPNAQSVRFVDHGTFTTYYHASPNFNDDGNFIVNAGGSGSHNHNAGHNLSGSMSGSPDRGTLSGSLSSASASINVKYQDFIIAQKD